MYSQEFYDNGFLPLNTSINAPVQSFSINSEYPRVEEFADGIFIRFGGTPRDVEDHDATVQIWRDERGRIVSIDIVYLDDEDEAPK
ncbi:hypothetical protein [Sulfurisphaera tokodaii]|uniref:Uncharacterized protein n=1 Tax=Sulfurisphaera tokodaii TaxID=111955 RepID=A0A832T9E1_9CREN|nr:hypothetical protein [Sulfurisphaera tokodaii]HII74190.1 hypothetical protein [Sulfurisphaera tokodaii]